MAIQVRFELPDPAYEAYTWLLQDEFFPAAQPPLLAGPDTGLVRPGDSSLPPRRLRINGYLYTRLGAAPPAQAAQPPWPSSVEELRRWRVEWLPQVEAFARQLEAFAPGAVPPGKWSATIEEQEAEYQRIFTGVHLATERPGWLVTNRFSDAFVASFGEHRRHDALSLLQGFPNRSTDRSVALWDLSRLLRADAALARALESGADASTSPTAREFRQRFAAMLEEFGHTNSKEMQDVPTWEENPSVPLTIVRACARQGDDRSPRETVRRQRERRLQLEGELRERAQADAVVAALVPLMEMAQQLLPNLEDHNLLVDQRIAAASRARWLLVGTFLQQRGSLAAPEDVFHYRRGELIEALESGIALPRDEVAARRAFHQACRETPPPPTLGRPPEEPLGGWRPAESAGPSVLRGTPASAGVYRGRARVIESFGDAAYLEEGDVLVARSTTPSWTPYFALVGAVVTNAGGILSHSALVAREFGMPAVVGTRYATVLVPDGAMVTVDGTSGIVIVEERAPTRPGPLLP